MDKLNFDLMWKRVVAAVRAAPGKTAFLGALIVVFGIVCARLLPGGAKGPKAATASAVNTTRTTPSAATVTPPDESRALRQWLSEPVPQPRDLFAIKLEYFPQDGKSADTSAAKFTDTGLWEKVAKSMAIKADQEKERQILIGNLRVQAARLKLQTTLMGRHPRAMVNGELIGEGDMVAAFRVLKIEPRRMIVEQKGIQLAVEMQ